MQAIKQPVTVSLSRELHIKLPEDAVAHEEAEIIVLFKSSIQTHEDKFAAMDVAVQDQLFLADLHETMNDFER